MAPKRKAERSRSAKDVHQDRTEPPNKRRTRSQHQPAAHDAQRTQVAAIVVDAARAGPQSKGPIEASLSDTMIIQQATSLTGPVVATVNVDTFPPAAVLAPCAADAVAASGSSPNVLRVDARSSIVPQNARGNRHPANQNHISAETNDAVEEAYSLQCPITRVSRAVTKMTCIFQHAHTSSNYLVLASIDRFKLVPKLYRDKEYRESMLNLLPLHTALHRMFDKAQGSIFPALSYLQELLRGEVEHTKYRQEMVDKGFDDPGREFYSMLGDGNTAIPVQVQLRPSPPSGAIPLLRMNDDDTSGAVFTAPDMPDALPTIWLYTNVALFVYGRLDELEILAAQLECTLPGSTAAATGAALVATAKSLKTEWERVLTPSKGKKPIAKGKTGPPPKPSGPRWAATNLELPAAQYVYTPLPMEPRREPGVEHLPFASAHKERSNIRPGPTEMHARKTLDQRIVHPSPVQAPSLPVPSPPSFEQQQADAQDNTERRVLRSGKQAPLALTEQALSNVEDGVRTMAAWRRESALHHHQLG